MCFGNSGARRLLAVDKKVDNQDNSLIFKYILPEKVYNINISLYFRLKFNLHMLRQFPQIRLATVIAILLLAATARGQSPTLPAQGFNIFALNNLSLTTNETEGPIACGGDLSITGNYQVCLHNAGNFMVNGLKIGLLVGGKVNYQSGNALQVLQNAYVKIGNGAGSYVWYYDQNNAASPIRITPTASYDSSPKIMLQANSTQLGVGVNNNPVIQGGLLDFTGAFQTLRASSLSLSQCIGNAQLTNPNGQPIPTTGLPNQVKINLQDGVNYLNVTGTDLNNVQVFTFNQQPGASKVLVVNVDAPGTFNWNVWNQSGIGFQNCPYILYNFYNTTQLNIKGSSVIEGTVFAPFADVDKTVNQANLEGQVICKSLAHSGGEIHYAVFAPSLTGCAPVAGVAPVAGFNINNQDQCLNTNSYVFDNTSNTGNAVQPEAPISYLWDFGDGTTSTAVNPVKVYSTPGIYMVKLVATNTYGSSSSSTQVVVHAPVTPIVAQSTVSSGNGLATKQLVFTNNGSFGNYSWSLPGTGTGLYPNQPTVNFTFTEAGYYEVTLTATDGNGCAAEIVVPVVIASEDVNTGNDGGLESESLGDAVSKRYVQRKKKSIPTTLTKTDRMRYNKTVMAAEAGMTARNANGLTLPEMFPGELMPGNVAHVTSPTDILDYTVADEVLSVDFSVAGKTKAVVLGVRTTDKVYNHTKASCDRLRGAEILTVKPVQVEGYNFLMQAIKQRNGVTEYAVSFAVGKNNNQEKYTLQSNWFVKEYAISNNVYNFQVWATQPEHTMKLVKDIINNLNADLILEQTEIQKLPQTYAAKVSREGVDMVLKLKSIKEGQNIEINMEEVYSETHGFANRYNPVISEKVQTVRLEVKDGYEYDGLIKVNGQVQDAFYHADGNWGLDFDPAYTTINQYIVSNNFDREYYADELPVHRNVKLQAHSEYDYLTLYKSLLPGHLPADYTDYGFISFKAKGSGLLEIGLVKSSVQNWNHQYRAVINVRDSENIYYIPYAFFKSAGTNQTITADDLTMLTFTFLPVEAGTNDLDLTIEDVKFTKTAPAGYEELLINMNNEFITYPNPSRGDVNCLLYSDAKTTATVTLHDISGKLIYSAPVELTEGRNDLMFNFGSQNSGMMFLNITSHKTNYGTSKIVFK
jgi:choice-of-anchor A domain-containing protein